MCQTKHRHCWPMTFWACIVAAVLVVEATVSPLAKAIYDILRRRPSLAEPRISYADLARRLRDLSEEFEFIYHRSRALYAALGEVGMKCRRLRLPPLPALVVRADTRRPGAAYYAGACAERIVTRGSQIAAWRQDLEAVKQAKYPAS